MTRQRRERLRYLAEAVPLLRQVREQRAQAEQQAKAPNPDDGAAFRDRIIDLATGKAEKQWRQLLATGSEARLVAELRRLDDRAVPHAPCGADAADEVRRALRGGDEAFLAAIDRLNDSKRAELTRAICRRRHMTAARAAAIIEGLKIGSRSEGDPAPTADRIMAAVKKATKLSS